MGQNERPDALAMRGFPVIPPFNVSRDALLPALEDNRPDLAGLLLLLLDAVVNKPLGFVQ